MWTTNLRCGQHTLIVAQGGGTHKIEALNFSSEFYSLLKRLKCTLEFKTSAFGVRLDLSPGVAVTNRMAFGSFFETHQSSVTYL